MNLTRSFFKITYGFVCLLLVITGCSDNDNNFNIEKNSTIPQSCLDLVSEGSSGGSNVTVQGMLRYEDKEFDENGYSGTPSFKPIRYANIEVVRCSDQTVIASVRSEADGSYSITFSNPLKPGIYIRVMGKTEPDTDFPNIPDIVVKDNITNRAVYSLASDAFDDGTNTTFTHDLDATVSSLAGGAFNILDSFTEASDYVRTISGGEILPPLTVYWESGGDDGTYFESSDDSIHVLGKQSDPDEYDDDVIIHEFGHFVASHLSNDDSIGGTHLINDSTQDIRLAWSEGWATFFARAVRGTPVVVDVNAGGTTSFDVEKPSYTLQAIYTTNELSISAVLWDIYDDDSTDESFDTLSLGITQIWDIFANYLPTATDVSMEDFWDGLRTTYPSYSDALLEITKDRRMELFADTAESADNTIENSTSLTLNVSRHHTSYPADDIDYLNFTLNQGSTYTIKTAGLNNGADTFIQLIGSDGATIISSNDNFDGKSYTCVTISTCPDNDSTTLSSKISFTAASSGTFYARITHSSEAPPSAGTYGAYDILLTSP